MTEDYYSMSTSYRDWDYGATQLMGKTETEQRYTTHKQPEATVLRNIFVELKKPKVRFAKNFCREVAENQNKLK